MNTLSRLLFRTLLALIFIIAAPLAVHAEKRIGVVMTGDVPYYATMHEAFVDELNKKIAGTEKIEIILQRPFPNSISWSNAARKLIAFDVDLIVTYGSPATQAVLHEKSRIPHVYAGVYEPDQADVTGKNLTGCGFKVPLSSLIRYFKRLKTVKTLGIIFSGIEEDSVRQYEAMREIAEQQNIQTEKIDIRAHDDLGKLRSINSDAVFITGSTLAHLRIDEIISILRKEQIPTADIFPDSAETGILMTLYQPPHLQGEMAAEMAAQILHGKAPGGIAAHTFRDTELVFNLAEARHLGINFPIHLIIEATRVVK